MFPCVFSYEQQLADLQATQSNIVSELHHKQSSSSKAKDKLQKIEESILEAEGRKQTVSFG